MKTPIYGEDFNLIGNSQGGTRALIVLDIGRPSRGCRGIGVCQLCLFCESHYESQDWNKILAPINQDLNGNKYIELHLESSPSSLADTNLYIEGNLLDENGNIVINAGVYSLDNSLGSFGGYKININ